MQSYKSILSPNSQTPPILPSYLPMLSFSTSYFSPFRLLPPLLLPPSSLFYSSSSSSSPTLPLPLLILSLIPLFPFVLFFFLDWIGCYEPSVGICRPAIEPVFFPPVCHPAACHALSFQRAAAAAVGQQQRQWASSSSKHYGSEHSEQRRNGTINLKLSHELESIFSKRVRLVRRSAH